MPHKPFDIDRLLAWAAQGEPGATPVYEAATRQVRYVATLRGVIVSTRSRPTEAEAVQLATEIRRKLQSSTLREVATPSGPAP